MEIKRFKTTLSDIKEKVLVASNMGIDFKKAITSGQYIYDYKMNKAKYMIDRMKKSANDLVTLSESMEKKNRNDKVSDIYSKLCVQTKLIVEQYLEPKKVLPIIENIDRDIKELEKVELLEKEISDFEKEAAASPRPKHKDNNTQTPIDPLLNFTIPSLPEEIHANVEADFFELQRCYENKCYRSATILCGRIIETALHRKYFEVTGKDALEKEPGIGIGKLIARMSEQGIHLDPSLPQMVHLINQVRIFSVHTKQHAYNPNKNQTRATVLYTTEVLTSLFANKVSI